MALQSPSSGCASIQDLICDIKALVHDSGYQFQGLGSLNNVTSFPTVNVNYCQIYSDVQHIICDIVGIVNCYSNCGGGSGPPE